jgi:hypothetical protein
LEARDQLRNTPEDDAKPDDRPDAGQPTLWNWSISVVRPKPARPTTAGLPCFMEVVGLLIGKSVLSTKGPRWRNRPQFVQQLAETGYTVPYTPTAPRADRD